MTITVRHWKNSYKCDHAARKIEGALVEALRCANLSTSGSKIMTMMLEVEGRVQYVVPDKDVLIFSLERGH